jgi:hypothetical protein
MTSLERWLRQATRCLAQESAEQVQREIREHHDAEREAAKSRGANAEEADRLAMAALGDAKAANRQYRKVLLTAVEMRMLQSGNREARAICARPWLKWTLVAGPLTALVAALAFFIRGEIGLARTLVLGGTAMSLVFAGPFLPVYTTSRARVYRSAKWILLAATFCLAFGADALKYSWLLASCLWIPVWTEWTRFSIRRKLPVTEWPRQLYL